MDWGPSEGGVISQGAPSDFEDSDICCCRLVTLLGIVIWFKQ